MRTAIPPEAKTAKYGAGIGHYSGLAALGGIPPRRAASDSPASKVPGLNGLSSEEMAATAKAGGTTKIWGPMQAGQDVQQISKQGPHGGVLLGLDGQGLHAHASHVSRQGKLLHGRQVLSPFEKSIHFRA